jgi:site-specific DNA recombinase
MPLRSLEATLAHNGHGHLAFALPHRHFPFALSPTPTAALHNNSLLHKKSASIRRPLAPSTPNRIFGTHSRRWLDEIVSGSVTDVQQIATRQKCSARQVNMTLSLAFLAPDLVRAAVEGRLPRGIGVERLRDASAEWSQQFEALGLNPL